MNQMVAYESYSIFILVPGKRRILLAPKRALEKFYFINLYQHVAQVNSILKILAFFNPSEYVNNDLEISRK